MFSVSSDAAVVEEGEEPRVRWQRSSTSVSSPRKSRKERKERRNRARGRSSQECRLERKEMRVHDLGLGYDSDEIVLFKYCIGTCMSARRNYDLALKVLMDNGSVPSRKVSTQPCCRPTRFETVSFMDAQTSWQTIKWLSAANCSCLGWDAENGHKLLYGERNSLEISWNSSAEKQCCCAPAQTEEHWQKSATTLGLIWYRGCVRRDVLRGVRPLAVGCWRQ